MGMDGYTRLWMVMHGYRWLCTVIDGYTWLWMVIHGYGYMVMDGYGCL